MNIGEEQEELDVQPLWIPGEEPVRDREPEVAPAEGVSMEAELWIATTPMGQPVRLSNNVWVNKILVSHPELATEPYVEEVRLTLVDPDFTVEGWAGELLSLRWCATAPKRPKHMCVVYREADPVGFVITAFFILRYDKLLRRKIRWQKRP